ncbi:hypothetical protein [Actinomadura miaoliensis]|uniref:Uncharacterized protein n=1 Tax=Actinomadura miaoliensis TaxID=430685 RepID=A0ABP7V2C4_9ACTN
METHGSPPSPAEAAAALRAAEQARAAGTAPIPAWFFPAVGLLVAAGMASVMLPGPAAVAVLVVVVAGLLAVNLLYSRRVDGAGIEPRRLTARQGAALGAPLPVAVLACELLDDRWSGVWAVAGVVLACWAIGYGRRHARRVRTAK